MNQGQRQRASRISSVPQVLPAPVGGWNTRDPFEEMDATDAPLLDNWDPGIVGVAMRGGLAAYATGLGSGAVETIAAYSLGSVKKCFAAASGVFWDITSPGDGISTAVGFADDRWQSANFNGHLIMVNGTDPPQDYNGTAWAPAGFTGSGLNVNDLYGVAVINSRLFFWKRRQAGFWYGGVDSISGNLSFFPFNMVSPDGANLVAVSVLSYDGGTGLQSYTVFVLDTGEALVYLGTDPSNADNWSLAGRYILAPPVDVRAICRYGGDIYITTASDHTQLSKLLIALKLGETPPRSKIAPSVAQAYTAGSFLSGWQAIFYPLGRRIIFNIPNPDGSFDQHVMNTTTQAWSRYKGINASCWGLFGDKLLFGGIGVVGQQDVRSQDVLTEVGPPWDTSPWDTTPWSLANGSAIVAEAQQAWNLFKTPTRKRVAAARPILQSDAPIDFGFALGFDYIPAALSIEGAAPQRKASPWDVSPWDTSPWSDEIVVSTGWKIAGGSGSAISVQLGVSSKSAATWVRTDLRIEPGAAL